MADKDPLDTETSVAAELTPTGLKASAKSRFIAAADRLLGNIVELGNVRLETGISRRRAVIEGERALIAAAADHGVKRMGRDPQFVERALANHLQGVLGKQQNKDAVVHAAIEDLRSEVPIDIDAEAGPEQVDEAFMARFESYAESATAEDVRERWGKVLAAEIRTPGTFSAKVLRLVDEIDSETAATFQTFCEMRVIGAVPTALTDTDHRKLDNLREAGLLLEHGLGRHLRMKLITLPDGLELFVVWFEKFVVGFPKGLAIDTPPFPDKKHILGWSDDSPTIPAHVLSAAGRAIASILPDTEARALKALADAIGDKIGRENVYSFHLDRAAGLIRRIVP